MDRRGAVVAGLIALLAIACGGPAGGPAGGAEMPDDDANERRDGVIDGLLNPGDGDGDQSVDAGDLADADAPEDPYAADAAATADSSIEGDAGDGDDAAMPGCPDADSDTVCDADDTCPIGVEAKCDAILWTIELPSGSHEVAPNTRSVHFGLTIESQGESRSIVFEMAADGTAQSFDFDASDIVALRDFVGQAVPTLRGRVVMSTLGDTVVPVTGEDSVCPVDPRVMVVRRASVSGMMSADGQGGVLVEVRGYVEPQ